MTDAHTGSVAEHDSLRSLAASASLAAFVRIAAAATVEGGRRCFFRLSAATSVSVESASATAVPDFSPAVVAQVKAILTVARSEILEDGMRNSISDRLPALMMAHHDTIIAVLAGMIEAEGIRPAITAEVLKEVGRTPDAGSYYNRRWLLEHALSSTSPWVRDGAAVGLSWLSDAHAAPYLEAAIEREQIPQLKADLQSVLAAFGQATMNGSPAPQNR